MQEVVQHLDQRKIMLKMNIKLLKTYTFTSPASGFNKFIIILMTVDFPAPFEPMKPVTPPFLICKFNCLIEKFYEHPVVLLYFPSFLLLI
ncbi:hypothetical protein TU51_10885 [Bacillus cytotoxicus]|nr:hypothetical protein TU51_10885 [Bacillus cytotoxicus]